MVSSIPKIARARQTYREAVKTSPATTTHRGATAQQRQHSGGDEGGIGAQDPTEVTEMRALLVRRIRQSMGLNVPSDILTGDTIAAFVALAQQELGRVLNYRALGSGLRLQQTSSCLRGIRQLAQIVKLQYPAQYDLEEFLLDWGRKSRVVLSDLSEWLDFLSSEAAALGLSGLAPRAANFATYGALLYAGRAQQAARESGLSGRALIQHPILRKWSAQLNRQVSPLERSPTGTDGD